MITKRPTLTVRLPTNIKSPSLPKNQKKRLLPNIQSSFSPDQKSNLKSSKDLAQSPLLSRTVKSQVQFGFLKQEDSKVKHQDRKTSLVLAQIAEKSFEQTSKDFFEQVATPRGTLKNGLVLDKVLNNQAFLQCNGEELETNKDDMQKMTDLAEYDSEKNESLEDEIRSLKGITIEQTKAYAKLEELYFEDTNFLKRENEKLKQSSKKFEDDYNHLKLRLDVLNKNYEEGDKNNTEKVTELTSKLEYCQISLKEKTSELFQLSEYVRKLQAEKKNREESFKELQKQCSGLSDNSAKLEQDLAFQKREVKLVSENNLLEKEKIKVLEMQLADYVLIKEKYRKLEDSLNEYQKSADFTSVNYNELKSQFNSLQALYDETDQKLRIAQDKLFDSKINPVGNRNSKLRRTSTLVLSNNETQDKDSISRLNLRISELEEELQNEKLDKEKIKKDLEYCKKAVDEKTEIISKINRKIEDDVSDQVRSFKFGYFVKINEIGRRVEWLVDLVKEKFKCELCGNAQNPRYIGLMCQHLFCKNCAMIKDSCSSCIKSKLIKVKLLKNISVSYIKLSESVSELFLLINS